MISRKVIIGGIIVLALTSCKTLPEYKKSNPDRTALITSSKTPSVPKGDSTRLNEQVASKGSSQTTSLNKIYTPILKNVPSPSKEKLQKYEVAGDLSVELTKVDIKQAIKIILGDILKLNYVLHPNVRGLVTLRTVRPITKTQMLGLLDAVLEAHGLMAVHGDGIVQIIPSSSKKDAKVTHLLKQTKDGFGVEVIPLTNIPTGKMLKLLAPVVEKDDVIDLPGMNNLLLISGIKKQRITIKKLIELLDVDAMASQYVAIVSLRNTRPEVMISELEQILSPRGNGLVRFTPIKRLNALMAITPNQKLIETVNLWIARLDKTKDADERRLFVYFVKHSDATALTETLKGVFASSVRHRRGILQDNNVKNKDTKKNLRKKYLKLRKNFFIKKFNFDPLFKIINKNFSNKKFIVAAYFPYNYEVDVTSFIKMAILKNYKIALPVIYTGNNMKFKIWNFNDPLMINKYGILEPNRSNKTVYPDCFLVPLAAYDNNLNRIGYGKGYYDRALKKIIKVKKKSVFVGIAFSFQQQSKIPTNKYDVKLDYIFTERGIISSNY